jgi:hypothetical protein
MGFFDIFKRTSKTERTDAGFLKHTSVPTKEGFKRIAEIKNGDWVLSSPEDGSGKSEYKRVLNTFVFRNKPIRHIDFIYDVAFKDKEFMRCNPVQILDHSSSGNGFMVATGDCLVWVEGTGWMRVGLITKQNEDFMRSADGCPVQIVGQVPVFRFRDPIPTSHGVVNQRVAIVDSEPTVLPLRPPEECKGFGFSCSAQSYLLRVNLVQGMLFDYEHLEMLTPGVAELDQAEMPENDYLEMTVYGLEIEDFHTYYVGKYGIWVHDVNCDGIAVSELAG